LKWIDYVRPETLSEAVALLAERGDKVRILAGGTDLIVHLRAGALKPDLVVDGKGIAELNELSYSPQTGLTLGAAVPCYKVYQNKEVASAYPGLIDAASLIGGTQIQGRASIGGNLCNAVPSADSIPAMIAHNVTCKIVGPNGIR
jgi:carbon-monoxide dehydrogenase medium subunit